MNASGIGHNNPPGAIELAEPTIEALSQFLKDFPVISNEDEAREAKPHLDRMVATLKAVDDERKAKVGPLNEQVKTINVAYHKWHCTDHGRPGLWTKLYNELRDRVTVYARRLEDERRRAAQAARIAAEEAERKAREAEEREREATATAAAGVCDVDIAAASQEADDDFRDFKRLERISLRALRNAKVRIGGGFGKVSTLRNKEILTVSDWRAAIAAIEEISDGLPAGIEDAILTGARACRKLTGELPPGIQIETERSL
jgi:hypothetical protein